MEASQTLRDARAQAGLTLRALAVKAGTSHSTLAAYESGAKVPSVETLTRVVRAAGFELDTSMRRRYRTDGTLTRGEELVAVLELAGHFPARHTPNLEAPIFGRIDGSG